MDLNIRPFAPADQQAARELILTGLGEHFGFIDQTRNPDVDDIWGCYVAAGHRFLVAEQAGRIVGTAALVNESPDCGRIKRVSVAPDCRRCGIAWTLVARLVAEARAAGLARLLVETNHDWEDALGLYGALGFIEYARDEESAYLALNALKQIV